MMKVFLFSILFVVAVNQVTAQDMLASLEKTESKIATRKTESTPMTYTWEFWSALKDYTTSTYAKTDELLFGREVACLLSLMDEQFVRREQVVVGDPTMRTSISKPVIYNTVKNIEKYYRRKMKNKTYTLQDGDTFAYVVKVALASIDSETIDFEESLQRNRKDVESQISSFCRVKLKDIY